MRFMVIVKADQRTEAGILPSQELLEQMGKYNDCLLYTSDAADEL